MGSREIREPEDLPLKRNRSLPRGVGRAEGEGNWVQPSGPQGHEGILFREVAKNLIGERKMLYHFVTICFLLLFLFLPQSQALEPGELQQKAEEAVRTWKRVQELEDRWATEREKLLREIEGLEAQKRLLLWKKEKMEKYVADLKERIAELKRRTTELKKMNQELEPYLDETIKRLREFIKGDLPFLMEERKKRLLALQSVLDSYDAGIAEKLRRVLEALRVEVDYGGQAEVTEEQITPADGPRTVQVFRLGRLALFYRTLDGKEIGRFNPETGRWEKLPGRFSREMERAMEMAARRRAAELLKLPIGGLKK